MNSPLRLDACITTLSAIACCGVFVVAPAELAGKDIEILAPAESWSLPGLLGTGIKSTDQHAEGQFFLVLPVVSTLEHDGQLGGDVIFVEPYASWGEQGEAAASLGLGWRHLFSDQNVAAVVAHDGHQASLWEEGAYVGANFFLDMLDTQFDNRFWQMGVGVEAGSRYLEARANYYFPLSDSQLGLEERSTQTYSSSRTRTSRQVSPINDPYATGNTIAQDVNFTTLATTTTSTTTVEQLFRLYEEGMEGWDAQIALLVPGLDRYLDVKLIGGYYAFDNQPFGPQTGGTGNVEGWKAGLEIRPVPAVLLNATWYEDERFVGSDWLFGAQLQVPFEIGDLGDGKGFWSRIGDAFKPRRRHLVERLAEPVHRQNQAIRVGNDVEQEVNVSTSVKRTTRVVSQSAQHRVLEDDVIFVNNGGPTGNGIQTGSDASGDGTAEKPFETIQKGANLGQGNSNSTGRVWNVYTQGTPPGYAESVLANTGSVNFIGSGQAIEGVGGRSFGTGPAPVLMGGFGAASIDFLGVTAYEITGGFAGDNGINTGNVANVLLQANTIHDVKLNGINVTQSGGNAGTARILGNTIASTGGDGVSATSNDASNLILIASGNTTTATGENGFSLTSNLDSTLDATLSANQIFNSVLNGVFAESDGASHLTLLASGNRIATTVLNGFNFASQSDSTLDATLVGNTIENIGASGVSAESLANSDLTLLATANTISSLAFNGFTLLSNGDSLDATLSGNTISGAAFNGVFANTFFNNLLTLVATDNTITTPGQNGFSLASDQLGLLDATLSGNTITGAGSSGIFAESIDTSDLILLATGNTITTPADFGINLASRNGSTLDATVNANNISGAVSGGMVVTASNTGDLTLLATGNTITTPGVDGIDLSSFDDSILAATLSNNSILGAGFDAVFATSSGTSDLTLLASGNSITAPADTGFNLQSFSTSILDVTLDLNDISGFGANGVNAFEIVGSTLTVDSTALSPAFNNLIGPAPVGFFRFHVINAPSGTVRINDINHDAGTDLP